MPKPFFTVPGAESFRLLRERGACYVDKSDFIAELLAPYPPMVTLLTRPRRFGKTLTLDMLDEFFRIDRESHALFQDLQIAQNGPLCSSWMNAFPVLNISLKDAFGTTFSSAIAGIVKEIRRMCRRYKQLLTSPNVLAFEKNELKKVTEDVSDLNSIKFSLYTLSAALEEEYEKPVIILIDEYDVPLNFSWQYGYYNEMTEFLRGFFSAALKTNSSLQFAVLTGCLRIAKESFFTGVNNFVCCGVADNKFSDKLGFTEKEVDHLLVLSEHTDKKDSIKEWYDGYTFGNQENMYCPWDIIQYINELQTDHTCIPKNYWMNTSGNDIIQDLVQYSSDCIVDTFTSLLQGESIAVKSLETLSYPDIFRVKSDTPKDGTDEYIWHLLYCTGYLTTAKRDQAARDTQQQHLMIPNREIQGVCAHCVQQWFIQKTKTLDTNALFEAFWLSDAESVTTLLSDILLATISYYDYHESFYHAFVAGLFVSPDYAVQSNRESGLGRADLLIFDRRRKRSACIEIKVAESESDLAGRASIALQQIASMKYGEQHDPFLRNYPQKPLHWGFAFYKKDCLALCSR